jgi:hypothetical protein
MRSAFTKQNVLWGTGIVLGAFLLIQLVPYGRDHSNPPVTGAPKWDSPHTEALFMDACGDCHSNLTTWPIESNVAPFSWLIERDVQDGREAFNVSRWDQPQEDAAEAPELAESGEMPPLQYKLLHSSARLSDSEKRALADGLRQTFAQSPPGSG